MGEREDKGGREGETRVDPPNPNPNANPNPNPNPPLSPPAEGEGRGGERVEKGRREGERRVDEKKFGTARGGPIRGEEGKNFVGEDEAAPIRGEEEQIV
jgi:hypothetical protein